MDDTEDVRKHSNGFNFQYKIIFSIGIWKFILTEQDYEAVTMIFV